VARAARVAAVGIIAVAAVGALPRLLLTQALLSATLTMVLAPLCLLDVGPASRWRRLGPFPACILISAGTVAVQLPWSVGVLGHGGVVAALALVALLFGAIAFWSLVIPPGRLSGLAAAGYVIVGGSLISMPALLLIMAPRDLYPAYHATGSHLLDGHTDQMLSGFVLFGAVKVVIFIAFSAIFFAASREVAADSDDDGGSRHRRVPPGLPSWALDLGPGSPSVEEPAAEREREAVPGR
jgi:hypothetical protein